MPSAAPRYSVTAIALHWLMAALIFTSLGLGFYMADFPLSPSRVRLFNWHKWLGITILMLAAARLVWRLLHPAPPLPEAQPRWQQRASHIAHWTFYVLFLAVPLMGWAYSSAAGFPLVYLGLFPLPDWVPRDKALAEALESAHAWLSYGLAAVVALHIAAALKHAIVDRDGVLGRMLPWRAERDL